MADKISVDVIKKELANSITHGIGVLLSVIGVCVLISKAVSTCESWIIAVTGLYSFSLILVYLSSTLYHSFQNPTVKLALRKLDHISIYFMIAGSYTPFTFLVLDGGLAWTLFSILWAMVAVGSIFKLFYVHKFNIISTIIYLAMGWMAIFFIGPIINTLPTVALVWLVIGGLSYSLGTIFYLWKGLFYHHAIWHVFVLVGSISHYIAIMYSI